MSTKQSTVDFITDQLTGACEINARKMFGEYALYCDAKVVGLICDDQLFIKPSEASAPYEDECDSAPPYPGAKNYLLVPEEKLEDREWLCSFIRATADAVPLPKKKK